MTSENGKSNVFFELKLDKICRSNAPYDNSIVMKLNIRVSVNNIKSNIE